MAFEEVEIEGVGGGIDGFLERTKEEDDLMLLELDPDDEEGLE